MNVRLCSDDGARRRIPEFLGSDHEVSPLFLKSDGLKSILAGVVTEC